MAETVLIIFHFILQKIITALTKTSWIECYIKIKVVANVVS